MLTNILSFSVDAVALFHFYAAARNVIARETGCARNDLFDRVQVKFDSLKLIMQMVFKEKFPQKIHLLKDLSHSLKASSLLNQLVVDWLVNTGNLDNKPKKKIMTSKSLPRVAASPSPALSATGNTGEGRGRQVASNRKHLGQTFGFDKPAAGTSVPREKPKPQNNGRQTKENLERLNNERLYLLRAQEQTDVKVARIRTANADLVKEYNLLWEKGRKAYDMFFEMFYALKLNPKAKIAKMEFSEEEIGRIKDFKNFQKLSVTDVEEADENPMAKIIRCKSSKVILKSEVPTQSHSRVNKSTARTKEMSFAGANESPN